MGVRDAIAAGVAQVARAEGQDERETPKLAQEVLGCALGSM